MFLVGLYMKTHEESRQNYLLLFFFISKFCHGKYSTVSVSYIRDQITATTDLTIFLTPPARCISLSLSYKEQYFSEWDYHHLEIHDVSDVFGRALTLSDFFSKLEKNAHQSMELWASLPEGGWWQGRESWHDPGQQGVRLWSVASPTGVYSFLFPFSLFFYCHAHLYLSISVSDYLSSFLFLSFVSLSFFLPSPYPYDSRL